MKKLGNMGRVASMGDFTTTANEMSQMSRLSRPSKDKVHSRDTTGPQAPALCPAQDEAFTVSDNVMGYEEDPNQKADGASERVREPRRPTFTTYMTRTRYGLPGLYYHGQRQPRSGHDPEPYDVWVCSPIECLAATHDERGENHGLLLRFKPLYGPWRQWAMPLRLLKGSGEELRGELLDMGVRINPDAQKLLNKWLARSTPENSVIAASRVGWHTLEEGRAFVMPRRTIAPATLASDITFQSEFATQDDFATASTLDCWRDKIGVLCRGNPILVLAVSTALAGPLLELVHRHSAGIHLVGDSSNGKTTALKVAASVWGGPDFMRTWRATGNGLEGIAAALSDTALVLDEIGEADGGEIGATIYALFNGTGKTRASRSGTVRRPHRWRIALLSSGEHTLAAHMSEAGKRPKAGQSIRLLDVPAKRQHGAFDNLHHLADGRAFADHLQSQVDYHYGHVGPAFIEQLVHDDIDLAGEVDRFARDPDFTATTRLQGRAAKTLALIALAGEQATRYGLTGWKEGEALAAAIQAFTAWKAGQGSVQTEHEQILDKVRSFIERHGDARFSSLKSNSVPVRDRAGWWRDEDKGRVYLFNNTAMREALDGFDLRRGLDALETAGWIAEREEGVRSVRMRIDGRRARVYAIRPIDDVEASE
ncbi:DUF927 domain-containing protein [Halomonas lysinitropha]|uniref:DUF927 domain-containing protein n=1 Tax=Halomonas lysinitropha TaxID=2607506 RepID=A0A5K1I2K4_9GAMM|nr:DUF927 domain-containing protein [Halomonas lysinitropha]VVZ94641.1 hypothetical protein HALO32_00696 [Halomonas lysinitropha]